MSPANLCSPAQATMHIRACLQSTTWYSTETARVLHLVELALASGPVVASRVAEKVAEVLVQECRSEVVQGGLAQWQIEKVDSYISRNLDARLVVEELADLASLSVSHFSRAFKTTFGESPHARVMRIRLKHAQSLLRTTDLPLSEVSLACGLSDQSHLCRLFRRVFGTTPSAWRRALSSEAKWPSGVASALKDDALRS